MLIPNVRRDQTPQQMKGGLEQSGELREVISVFCTDSGDDDISESRGLLQFDELCNALALMGGLRCVPGEAL